MTKLHGTHVMRKIVYSLLTLPLIAFVVYLAVLPTATRKTFISEFKHRTASLFGMGEEPRDGPKGLRIERPEEYGLATQPGNASTEAADALIADDANLEQEQQ